MKFSLRSVLPLLRMLLVKKSNTRLESKRDAKMSSNFTSKQKLNTNNFIDEVDTGFWGFGVLGTL